MLENPYKAALQAHYRKAPLDVLLEELCECVAKGPYFAGSVGIWEMVLEELLARGPSEKRLE